MSSRYGVRIIDEPLRHWPVSSLIKCRITCPRLTLRELENCCISFDEFVGWEVHQIIFSVASLLLRF